MTSTEAIPPKAARLVREHVVAEGEDAIHGATFDGWRLRLAAGYRLLRVMPSSGRVVDQLETLPERGGLAYDGQHLWQLSEGSLQRLDPRTGFVLRSLTPPRTEITGLECIDSDLLLLHAGGRALARIETLDATPLADVDLGASLRGLAWVRRELWSSSAGELRRIDPASGRVLAQLALPEGTEVSDLAGDADGRLWCVDGSRRLRAFANR
jgi:hypothetical protein